MANDYSSTNSMDVQCLRYGGEAIQAWGAWVYCTRCRRYSYWACIRTFRNCIHTARELGKCTTMDWQLCTSYREHFEVANPTEQQGR